MNTTANRYSFLEILDRTFRIYRENFVTVASYVALVSIPIAILSLLLSRSMTTSLTTLQTTRSSAGFNSGPALLSSLVVVFLSLIETVLTYSVVSYIASESYFGRKSGIGEAFRATRSRLTRLGCGFVLFYMVLFVIAVAIFFITSVCSPAIIGIVAVVYIGLATFALLTPVFVLEDTNAASGINRAYGLGRARFWTAVIVLAAIYIISLVLNVALGSVLRLLGLSSVGSSLSATQLLNTLVTAVINVLITPLFPIAMTLLYYDTRTRVEGLDLALASVDKPDARPSDLISPPSVPIVTRRDLLNMVILGVGGIALSVVAGGLLLGIVNSLAPGLNIPR